MFIRTNAVAEAESEDEGSSAEPEIGPARRRTIRSIEEPRGSRFVPPLRARRRGRPSIRRVRPVRVSSSATRMSRAEASAAGPVRRTLLAKDRAGDDAFARDLRFVAGLVGRLLTSSNSSPGPFAASMPDRPRTAFVRPRAVRRFAARFEHGGRSLKRTGSSAVSTSSAPVQIDAPCFKRSLVPSARGSRGEPGTAKT